MLGVKWSKVVFVGCHTDDEFLCAGTLHRLARQGCEVSVISCCPAATEGDRLGGEPSVQAVLPEWHRALDAAGVSPDPGRRHFLGLTPSADLHPHRQRICQYVYDFCEREKPDAAIILSPEDENTAHAVVGVECERVLRGRVPCAVRLLFPWNYGLGRPNLYVTLSPEDLAAKARVIDCYQSQQFRYRYKEMLMAQAAADGLSVKAEAAEKFELLRWVA